MRTIKEMHLDYATDKGRGHTYVDTYDRIFKPYQIKEMNFLEIGVLLGGSLKMWHEYFPQATIWGSDNFQQVDTNQDFGGIKVNRDDVVEDLSQYERIKFIEPLDSRDKHKVEEAYEGVLFDVIVDDGDHDPAIQLQTFHNHVPFLSPDGIYVIEDVCGLGNASALERNIKSTYAPLGWDIEVETYVGNIKERDDDILLIIK